MGHYTSATHIENSPKSWTLSIVMEYSLHTSQPTPPLGKMQHQITQQIWRIGESELLYMSVRLIYPT